MLFLFSDVKAEGSAFNFGQSQGPIHGGTCDCKPDSTLKIQFLRVVHNMCDNTKDARLRRLLHSTHESARLRELHGIHVDGKGHWVKIHRLPQHS
jgi:hypothetical protein